ncbi:hypothetical protein D1872_277770 [compost metagenome]
MINPMLKAIIKASPMREAQISGRLRKAVYVAKKTIGFRIGPLNIKTVAMYTGMPLAMRRRMTGIMPHSQIGKRIPNKHAARTPNTGFLGIIRAILCSETKTCSKAEKTTPNKINGSASRKILMNIVRKVSRSS